MTKTCELVKRVLKYNSQTPLINRYFNTTNSKDLVAYENKFNYGLDEKIRLKYSPISYEYPAISQIKNKDMQRTYNKDDIKHYNQNFNYKSKVDWNFDW